MAVQYGHPRRREEGCQKLHLLSLSIQRNCESHVIMHTYSRIIRGEKKENTYHQIINLKKQPAYGLCG